VARVVRARGFPMVQFRVRVGYLTKGKGSGIASKGKDDPKKRMVTITLLCEKEV